MHIAKPLNYGMVHATFDEIYNKERVRFLHQYHFRGWVSFTHSYIVWFQLFGAVTAAVPRQLKQKRLALIDYQMEAQDIVIHRPCNE